MEEERRKRQEPEDWRTARENNQPPNQPPKVFDQRNRAPPVHAAERDWGALRTSDPPARPPTIRQLIPSENSNDNRLPPPKLNKPPERDFADLRKEPRQIINPQQQPPMRMEKDFGNLRAPRKDDLQQAPISQSDQQDDWRRGGPPPPRKNLDENKDPRSSMPPVRKIPYQPGGGDRDFGNLRNNMQPRTGPPPMKRNLNDDDWRRGGDKRGGCFRDSLRLGTLEFKLEQL